MPIVLPDLSGLSEGISTAGGALANALQSRAAQRLKLQQTQLEQQKQSQGLQLVSDWARGYDSSKSPTENIGMLAQSLQKAGTSVDPAVIAPIIKGVLEKAVSQQGDIFGAEQLFGGGAGAQQPLPGQAPQAGMQQQVIPGQQAQGFGQQIQAVDQAMPGQRQQPPMPQQAVQQPQQAPQNRLESATDSQLVQWQASPNKIVSKAAEAEFERRGLDYKKFSAEREFHTKYSDKALENIDSLREMIPKKNAAFEQAETAVLSGGVGPGTWSAMGKFLKIKAFETSSGAQLAVAAKEHLFSNLGRISAKGQNIYMEQLLQSMFAEVGKGKGPNMTALTMLKGELEADKAQVQVFDRLAQDDLAKYGYIRRDINSRVEKDVAPIQEKIVRKTAYKARGFYENEKGDTWLKTHADKKQVKNTPLTSKALGVLVEKVHSDKSAPVSDDEIRTALSNAKKLGYSVPSKQEFISWQ